MSIYTDPNGNQYNIPTDPLDRQRFVRIVKEKFGDDLDETTILGQAKETLKGVPRGALSMVADVPLGVASLFDIGNDSDLVQGLQQYKDFLRTESSLAADPAYADKWMTKFGEGLGSFGPFLGAGAIGKSLLTRGVGAKLPYARNPMFLAPASIAAPAGIAQQVDRMNMAKEQGEDVGALAETFAELGGGVIGLSEVLPVFNLLKKVPKNASKYMDIKGALSSAAQSGGVEALQEVTASLSQDLLARGLYSDELPIGESLFDEFTIGGAVGAFADLAVNAMSGRTKSRAYLREYEKTARDNVASTIEENKFQKGIDQGDVEVAQDQPIGDKPNEITLPANPDIIPSLEVIEDANGAFNVIDATDPENPIVQTFAQETEALVFKDKQENNYQRKITKNEVDQAKYNLGLPESSTADVIGSTIRDPNIGEVNLSSVIDLDTTLSEEQKKVLQKERTDIFGPNKKAFSQARVARLGPKLNKIGKYVQSKGLDLKSNYSMAETQKILNKKDYTNLLKDRSQVVFEQSEKDGIPSIRADKEQVNTSVKAMKDLAASKNIDLDFKSPAVRYAALRWTGTENITKAGKPAKELFLARIHSLPTFSTETKFPDFRPREYTAIDVANFVASKASQDAEFTVKELLSEETSPTYKNKTATEQFISDLTTSGRAERVEGTNKYKIRKNFQYDIARRSEAFNETPDEYEARLRQENKVPEDVIQTLVEKARENQKGTLPPKEIEPKIINFAEAVEQGKINKFAQEAKKILNQRGLKETAVIVSDDILSTTTLAEDASGNIIYDPRITRATPTEGAVEGEYDVSTDTIFLSLNAVNPDGTASQEEIENRLMQVLDHEMIHALRTKDLITESEYQYLRKQVKRAKVPKSYDAQFEGQTFYDRAIALNSETVATRGREYQEEFFVEEAIAEMYRARNFKVQMPPKAKGIFNKMVEFFRSMGQAMRISGFKRTSQIFSEIEAGKVGSRERDVIRTLMQTDKLPPSAFDQEQAVEVEDEIGTEEDMDADDVVTGRPVVVPRIDPTKPFSETDADTSPITGVFIDGSNIPNPPPSSIIPYNKESLSTEEYNQQKEQIVNGLISAGIIEKTPRTSGGYRGVNDTSTVEVAKWLADNAPSEDYRIIARKSFESLKQLQKKGIKFPFVIDSSNKNLAGAQGHISYRSLTRNKFTLRLNNSKNYQSRISNGVNFEVALHEVLHSATVAQMLNPNKTAKGKKAYKELTLLQDKVNDYISEKGKEWKKLADEGKFDELDSIAENESKTMSDYIQRIKSKNKFAITNFEKHNFAYKVNGIQKGSPTKDVAELITYGLTNRPFQEFLEKIPYSPKGKKSLWNSFVETMRGLLGVPAKLDTALSSFLQNASNALEVGAEGITLETTLQQQEDDTTTSSYTSPTDERIESLNQVIYGLQRQLDLDTMSPNTRDRISREIYKLQDEVINLERSQEVEASGQVPLFSRSSKNIASISRENKRRLRNHPDFIDDPDALDEYIDEFKGEELYILDDDTYGPDRQYFPDVPLTASSRGISRAVLEDYGYVERQEFDTKSGEIFRNNRNQEKFYEDLGNNKFRLYFNPDGYKRRQATVSSPTLDDLLNESWFEADFRATTPLFSRATINKNTPVDFPPYEVLSKIKGKSLTEVMDVIAKEDKSLSIIARKTKEQLMKFEKQGVTYSINVIQGDSKGNKAVNNSHLTDETLELIRNKEGAKEILTDHFLNDYAKGVAVTFPSASTDTGGATKNIDIYLNNFNTASGLNYRVILHEAIHGATLPLFEAGRRSYLGTPKSQKAYEGFSRLRDRLIDHQNSIKDEMDQVYEEGRKELGSEFVGTLDEMQYLVSKGYNKYEIRGEDHPVFDKENIQELITYGLTDLDFQQYLEKIPYAPQGKKSVWDEFVEIIRELLGVPAKQNSALSEVLSLSQDMLSADTIEISNALIQSLGDRRGTSLMQESSRFATEENTSENIKLREAVDRAEEIVKQTPRGEIPIYNINASDVALKAAIEFNEDITAPMPSKNVPLFSRASIPSEFNDVIKRTGKSPEPTQPYGVRLLDVINNPVENIRKAFKDTRQNFIDKLDKVDKKILAGSESNEKVRLANNAAATSTMAALRMADRARGVFQSMLMIGTPQSTIKDEDALTNVQALEISTRYNPFIAGNKGTGGLMQIMAPLYANPSVNLEEVFGIYAKLKRVQKLQQEGREFETPITPKDLEQIRVIETKYKSVVEAWNNYQKWNNELISFAEDKGLLNAEQAELWREQSSYYPFYREMVDDEGITAPTIGGGSLPNNPLNIEMKGSQREINVNPVEAIARNSLSILTGAMKNDGTSKLLRDLETMGEARRVSPREKKEGNLNTIFSFEDGQKQYWEIDDVELFHGVQAIGGVKTDAVTRFLAFPSAILRDTVTRDPGFVVVNLLRDTLSAAVTSGAPLYGDGFTPMVDTVKNMFADISDLEKFGVIGGYDFQNDEGSVKQLMDRARRQKGLSPDNGMNAENAFYKLWDGLGALTTKSDGATRLAVYNAVYNDMKKRGSSEAEAQSEAAYQALEIINFGRRGLSPLFRVVTSAIPFMNARIQGLDVLYRSASGQYSATERLQEGETLDDVKNRIQRKFALRASAMIAATALYYLLVSDTDEYKEVKREVRDDNWIIPTGLGYAIKIPIPFEVGMLFKAIPERLIDATIGRGVEKDPAKSIFRQLGTSAEVPFLGGDISIQAIKPIFEVAINRNSFTNSEIVPYYQQKSLPAYQSRKSTNELARIMGEFFNISPIKIEHVINGYTGTLGGYVLDIIDVFTRSITGTPVIPPNINDIPVLKRLFIDLDKSGGLQQQFYELRSEVERATITLNKLKDQGRYDELTAYREHNKGIFQVKSQINAINRYMANYRKKRDRIMQRTDISMSAKSDMIRELELDRDRRLAIIPALREKANVPMISLGN